MKNELVISGLLLSASAVFLFQTFQLPKENLPSLDLAIQKQREVPKMYARVYEKSKDSQEIEREHGNKEGYSGYEKRVHYSENEKEDVTSSNEILLPTELTKEREIAVNEVYSDKEDCKLEEWEISFSYTEERKEIEKIDEYEAIEENVHDLVLLTDEYDLTKEEIVYFSNISNTMIDLEVGFWFGEEIYEKVKKSLDDKEDEELKNENEYEEKIISEQYDDEYSVDFDSLCNNGKYSGELLRRRYGSDCSDEWNEKYKCGGV